jgi:hypothetical protein
MCSPASFVLTKDKIFWGTESDSHDEIIAEHKLHADGVRGANIVRVEITPQHGNFLLPIDEWTYKLDQDDKPKWYDATECEALVRTTLPEWMAAKIVLPEQKIERVTDRNLVAVYGDIQSVEGGTIQSVRGGTIQSVYSGTIQSVEGGTIQSVYSGTIQSVEGGTIQSVEGGTIQSVRGGTIQYVEGGTIQDVYSGTIQSVYSGTIQSVYGGTIQSVRGGTIQSVEGGTIQSVEGGTIQSVYGGTIQSVRGGFDLSVLHGPQAVLIDRSGAVPVCYVGIQPIESEAPND